MRAGGVFFDTPLGDPPGGGPPWGDPPGGPPWVTPQGPPETLLAGSGTVYRFLTARFPKASLTRTFRCAT